MIENLEYTNEKGTIEKNDIAVYALSTCGFCRRGLQFLRENSITFKYVYVDKLEPEVKNKVKDELVEKYKERVVFPFLVLNNQKVLLGFVEDEWKASLLG
jgi:glutaredoxin